MGSYNTYGEVQLKAGICEGNEYKIGDKVDLADGVYIGSDGIVVVLNEKLAAVFDHAVSKWSDLLMPNYLIGSLNPVQAAVDDYVGNGMLTYKKGQTPISHPKKAKKRAEATVGFWQIDKPFQVETVTGEIVKARAGDYLMMGKGDKDLYPCAKEIFAKTYEIID